MQSSQENGLRKESAAKFQTVLPARWLDSGWYPVRFRYSMRASVVQSWLHSGLREGL